MHSAFTLFRTPTACTALAALQAAVSRGTRILVQYAFTKRGGNPSFGSQMYVASNRHVIRCISKFQ